MSENYVVVKLVSGETVMAMFEGEDDKFIKIDYKFKSKRPYYLPLEENM